MRMSESERARVRLLLVVLLVIASIAGCGSDEETLAPDLVPTIHLSVSNDTFAVGEESQLKIEVSGVSEDIFGIAVRIGYDSSVLSIDEDTGLEVGDLLGPEVLSFFQVDSSMVYVSVSKMAEENVKYNSENLATITMTGLSAGRTRVSVSARDFRMIDGDGTPADQSNVAVGEDVVIHVE